MSHLTIQKIAEHFEIFVDEKPLSTLLEIDRKDLKFQNNDLDYLGQNKSIAANFIDQLLGEKPPENQLGSARVVLYRCHCGSDYCGVISFQLQITANKVHWQDIGHQDDDTTEVILPEITFNKEDYFQYLTDFKSTNC